MQTNTLEVGFKEKVYFNNEDVTYKKLLQIAVDNNIPVNTDFTPIEKSLRKYGSSPDACYGLANPGRVPSIYLNEYKIITNVLNFDPTALRNMTLAHELGHVFMGHMKFRSIISSVNRRELEANLFTLRLLEKINYYHLDAIDYATWLSEGQSFKFSIRKAERILRKANKKIDYAMNKIYPFDDHLNNDIEAVDILCSNDLINRFIDRIEKYQINN